MKLPGSRLRRCKKTILFIAIVLVSLSGRAQTTIAIGSWRLHLSYHDIRHVEVAKDQIFAAGRTGILVFHREENTVNTFNKLHGLSGTGITSLKYQEDSEQLLVGYEDGNLDILDDNTIKNFSRLKDADVTTSKKINHISTRDNIAYISTEYGVVLFDLQLGQIKETWRDLGVAGEELAIYESVFIQDSIFLATANGVLAGSIHDNLLDFNNWKRFNAGALSAAIHAITEFNGSLYVAPSQGVYKLEKNAWVQQSFLQNASIQSLSASTEYLFMIAGSDLWRLSASGMLSQITDAPTRNPSVVRQDEAGYIWIGDQSAGLLSNTEGAYAAYIPNGPSQDTTTRLVYYDGKIYALAGGFLPSGAPLNLAGDINIFQNGQWSADRYPIDNLTDIAIKDEKTYISSFGSGIIVIDALGATTTLDETNSPLVHSTDPASRITALAPSANGLWVANFGGVQMLHLLKEDGTWDSYASGYPNGQTPIDLSVDRRGNVWMPLNPASGGGLVVVEPGNREYYKSVPPGGGALPHENVNCVAMDREGYAWIGTDAGVAYFLSPSEDAIKPIYENRFLLREEKITAIDIDGGNRKWVGTQHGVWLFNDTGEILIHHFTADNSPLLSDVIRDIEINGETGEVFISTDQGIASYRSDATVAGTAFDNIRIFPNPVHPGYTGTVGISGLANDAVVKITDIGGKLIWQTQANGGTATWNVRDVDGGRAKTGVYLVFAIAQDGRESRVGKLAVIE